MVDAVGGFLITRSAGFLLKYFTELVNVELGKASYLRGVASLTSKLGN